ncbi:unnamed protein product [Miscanthus lutarioriparius]|uniref:Uncharacterized protein n=1 Tax=Miscanthus lutarioriparius TaxID=422564 RepID=A0A811RQG3_9POAL|nr:unnamed protein product [Miscanthus lutarioriparius]
MAPPISADACLVEAASAVAASPAIAPNGMVRKDVRAPAAISVVSKQTVRPAGASAPVGGDLRLSVSDMPMPSCHYIQKGLFFPPPPPGVLTTASLVSSLVTALSRALGIFPTLAGRLVTLHDDSIVIREPDFRRNFFGDSTAVLRFPGGVGPAVTFDAEAPLRERILHFSAAAIRELKATANHSKRTGHQDAEANGKLVHDSRLHGRCSSEISSFQSLCAHIWRAVTRARRLLADDKTTTFRMAVNCRHRLRPAISPLYFGNAIQSVATTATVAELASNDLGWAAARLHATVTSHEDGAIRCAAAEWEAAPRCFPLGNPDGAALTMGSSPRFPMYDGNDFGWGRALAVRSDRANKFDGKMSAFPGQAGDGSVDVEVCLAPDTMARLLLDEEFLQYVSSPAP